MLDWVWIGGRAEVLGMGRQALSYCSLLSTDDRTPVAASGSCGPDLPAVMDQNLPTLPLLVAFVLEFYCSNRTDLRQVLAALLAFCAGKETGRLPSAAMPMAGPQIHLN